MRDDGIISKFTVLTDPMSLGYIPVAYGLTTRPGHTDETATELSKHRHVYKLWILSGRHNLIAHALFRDIAEFQEFTHETINNIQGITAYESSIATRSVSDEGSIVL
jgi:DNA-binding Lrp family transcriptional regulator